MCIRDRSVRTLEARNLCDTSDEDTCRVTVSDREHAAVHAHARLSGDDAVSYTHLRAHETVLDLVCRPLL